MKNAQLWRATFKNTLISIILFAGLFGILWLAEQLFPSLKGELLHFKLPDLPDNMGEAEQLKLINNWRAWIVGIPASVIGVAYILSVKDPANYTGFYPGILMSALLGVQFWLQGQYDSAFLYFCVFIPFLVLSIVNWRKLGQMEGSASLPEFLSRKQLFWSVLVLVVITAADYLLATYILQHNTLTDEVVLKLFNGLLISSSVLANFWLIYKKNDAWRYWVLYSLSGIALFILLHNIFSIVLFGFFLVINSTAGMAWYRHTPQENYGWLNKK